MFTLEEIKTAHAKVKSGADYPRYVQEIKSMGVVDYETFVSDGNTVYHGREEYTITSGPKFQMLLIEPESHAEFFIASLKTHQQGKSDFPSFRNECAENGVEKWIADLTRMTCTYYDKAGKVLLVETIPS
jgi:uncharacterized protein YbcV (DUF1398 family)